MKTGSFLTHLECGLCRGRLAADGLRNLCPKCGKPLLARYDLDGARAAVTPSATAGREPTMWRYRELLPVRDDAFRLCLGEGFTPLFRAARLEREIGHAPVYVKDEGLNPTGSFKARGLAAAVSRAFELGVRSVSIPTAGNAGCAMSAYAALAGLEAHVFMPADVPKPFVNECRVLGARVTLIDGLITDCGKAAREGVEKFGRFDVSTLKEPYRIEGKKTMGYEVAEQMEWRLPDVIIYPTGGGTGLVGMWKAFAELESLGWIAPRRPRMVSVQAAGCAPIVRAFHAGEERAAPWENARTFALGLRVPSAVADFLMLRALRDSGGTAIAVSEEAIARAGRELARTEGVFASPEGAACWAAATALRESGWLEPGTRTVLFNTGGWYKYADGWRAALGL